MKIAIINDTHFGARNDHQLFLDYFLSFFEKQFFPFLLENNIDTVFHLGDLMDRRKFVNFHTLNAVQSRFFSFLKEHKIKLHMIIGNHDTYYKNTNEINSAKELFGGTDNFYLYENPTLIELDEIKFAMLPWICADNYDQSLDFIKNTSANILCGHLELRGYEIMRGIKFSEGMTDEGLDKFEMVLSGHFHNKSTNKNVTYLGTQYEITFSDAEDVKGFHTFDTSTKELTFHKNNDKMFYLIKDISEITDFSIYKDKYVKLLITDNFPKKDIENIISSIENANPFDLTIVENYTIKNTDSTLDLSKDTITIINEEIDNLDIEISKESLKKITNEIYLEALDI